MKNTSIDSRRLQISLACLIVAVILIIWVTPPIRVFYSALREISSRSLCRVDEPFPRCEFALVYNKPPKTASTKIRDDLTKWSRVVNRRVHRCSPFMRQATFMMRECIPENKTGCAIVATHVILSKSMRQLLSSRIGDFKLLTSTRNPPDRIFSLFLQQERTNARVLMRNSTPFRHYLTEFNPWNLYNFHTGEGREGTCPLTLREVSIVTELVNSVDIVIDADLSGISNAILNYTNLFQLSDSVINQRTRGERNVTSLPDDLQEMIKSVSCVEEEMHRMFRLRMASVYQRATGIACLSNSRYPTPTCF